MSADTEKLRECPFCGEERIFLNPPSSTYPKGSINCPACLACMPGEVNEHELVASWNQRAKAGLEAALAEAREALEPFAREAEAWAGYDETEPLVEEWNGGPASRLTVCHLRRAASLSSSKQKDGE